MRQEAKLRHIPPSSPSHSHVNLAASNHVTWLGIATDARQDRRNLNCAIPSIAAHIELMDIGEQREQRGHIKPGYFTCLQYLRMHLWALASSCIVAMTIVNQRRACWPRPSPRPCDHQVAGISSVAESYVNPTVMLKG